MNSLRSCSFAQPSLHCLTKKACSGLREFSLNVTILDWLKHHIDAKYYQNKKIRLTEAVATKPRVDGSLCTKDCETWNWVWHGFHLPPP